MITCRTGLGLGGPPQSPTAVCCGRLIGRCTDSKERCRVTAEPPAFDPVAFKTTTRQGWDAVAEAWDRWSSVLATWLGPVTEAMLVMARLGVGDKLVDVAAGAGEPGLTAAERVGPTGSVLATDLSSSILAFADRAARERGVRNFSARVMDAEQLELPDGAFDVALSRGRHLLPRSAPGTRRDAARSSPRRPGCGRQFHHAG